MKMITLLFVLLTLSNHCTNAQARKISASDISHLDSLLSEGNPKSLRVFIDEFSSRVPVGTETPGTFQWDSVKTIYSGLLDKIDKATINDTVELKRFAEMVPSIAGRYVTEDAGPASNSAYGKIKELCVEGRINEAQKYYVAANYFRTRHIEGEKQRLLNNAKRVEDLLVLSGRQLEIMRQDRTAEAPVVGLDEASHLCDAYDA